MERAIIFVNDIEVERPSGWWNAVATSRAAVEALATRFSSGKRADEVSVFYDPDPTEPCGWWFEFNKWRRAGADDTAHMRSEWGRVNHD